jgi:hypothetical protein
LTPFEQGEEEPTLEAYIVKMIKEHKNPKEIVGEIEPVLDHDSEVSLLYDVLWHM